MNFIGILEYPVESQFVFERTFNLSFREPWQKWETSFANEFLNSDNLGQEDGSMDELKKLNWLDVEFYAFAKYQFIKRYKYFVKRFGKPSINTPSPNSRFAERLGEKKIARLKKNLPKSAAKEKLLKRLKQQRDKLKQYQKKVWLE